MEYCFRFSQNSQALTRETDAPFLEELSQRSLKEFGALKSTLTKDISETEVQVVELSTQILELITANGIEFSDFTRGSLPKHFKDLASKKFDTKY